MRFNPKLVAGVVAAAVAVGSSPASADGEFVVYGWASDIQGDVGTRLGTVPFAVDFENVLDKLEYGLQVRYEGRGDRWGGGFDATYLRLEDDFSGREATVDMGLFEGFAIYQLAESLDLLAGVRNLSLETELPVPGGRTVTPDASVTDAFLGVRVRAPLTKRLSMVLQADAGAGDSDQVWSALAALKWRLGESFNVILAYRVLDYELEGDARGVDFDVRFEGPAIGVSWVF